MACQEVLPTGTKCLHCPCGAGNAAAAETDILMVGAVANWASYGVAARTVAVWARHLADKAATYFTGEA